MPVLLAEPADHLGVERLAGRADDPQLLERVALAGVRDRAHRAQRGGRGEHVLDAVLREQAQLLLRVEAALARVDVLHRPVAPGAQQRADAGGPRPLAGAVEQLAVLDVVGELELLVREQVAVRVQDALRLPGGAGGVVELGRVVGRGVDRVVASEAFSIAAARSMSPAGARRRGRVEHEIASARPSGMRWRFSASVTSTLAPRVAQPVLDAVVAVEHGHREEDRARLVGAEEDRRGLGQRRQQRGHAIAALHAVRLQGVGELRGEVLQLAEGHLALVAAPVLPEHRHPVTRVLVAHIRGDVVTRGNLPAVLIAHIPVAAQPVLSVAHRSSSPRARPFLAVAQQDGSSHLHTATAAEARAPPRGGRPSAECAAARPDPRARGGGVPTPRGLPVRRVHGEGDDRGGRPAPGDQVDRGQPRLAGGHRQVVRRGEGRPEARARDRRAAGAVRGLGPRPLEPGSLRGAALARQRCEGCAAAGSVTVTPWAAAGSRPARSRSTRTARSAGVTCRGTPATCRTSTRPPRSPSSERSDHPPS